jgi:DNA polymerase-3 subunit alpha
MDPYREDLRSLVGTDLGDLDRIWASQPVGEKKGWRPEVSAVIAGQVIGVRRKGDSQVFVQLEDGRGRIECSAFSDALAEFGPLLTRDRILVIKGGLREDEFSGGFSLRIRQVWDYAQLCQHHAQRLQLRLDLRVPGLWERVDALMAKHRPGGTPLRVDLLMDAGNSPIAGMLDLNGQKAVRVDTELLDALRALPGVRTAKPAFHRPWTS